MVKSSSDIAQELYTILLFLDGNENMKPIIDKHISEAYSAGFAAGKQGIIDSLIPPLLRSLTKANYKRPRY